MESKTILKKIQRSDILKEIELTENEMHCRVLCESSNGSDGSVKEGTFCVRVRKHEIINEDIPTWIGVHDAFYVHWTVHFSI